MIISRTPFRISFFGGGTDYPVWYQEHGGSVLATTIDKYLYITCRHLPPFFNHKSRILYSQVEAVNSNDDIQHPSVCATLKYMNVTEGVEIHYDGDLPARTGLGSSSSFTVGLLHTLYALKNKMPSKLQLAKEAIHIEQNILEENVGCQDQVLAASGGLVRVDFHPAQSNHFNDFSVTPVIIPPKTLRHLQDHLLLYFTGFSRTASDIAKEQIKRTKDKTKELTYLHQMVDESISILTGNGSVNDFGRLLEEGWKLKRSLTSKITTPEIDSIYAKAKQAGAIGGKLLGAGGGGFMLFFVEPEAQPRVKAALKDLLHVPFRFEQGGSQIIFYQPDSLSSQNQETPSPALAGLLRSSIG